MGVRKRSAAQMEAIAEQEKEDAAVARRWFRAEAESKRRQAAEMRDGGGYQPTTGVGDLPDAVVRYAWSATLADWGSCPWVVPRPADGGYEPTSGHKPVGSSRNWKPRRL